MDCKQAEQYITMCVDGELDPAVEDVLTEHLEVCPVCRQEFEQEQQVKALIVERLRRIQAPAHLLEQIRVSLKTIPGPVSWWQRVGEVIEWYPRHLAGALAAMLMVGFVSVVMYMSPQKPPILIVELVKHHANCAIEITSSQPDELTDWFRQHGANLTVDTPSLDAFDYRLLGAHLCQMLHQDAAYLVYERDGIELSLSFVKNIPVDFDALDHVEIGDAQFYTFAYEDRNLVLWQNGDTIYSLVGHTTRDDLLAMAAETRSL